MQIRCPVCNALTTWQENRFRPFCSERCKLIDLGRWAMEEYKVVEPIDQQSAGDCSAAGSGDRSSQAQ